MERRDAIHSVETERDAPPRPPRPGALLAAVLAIAAVGVALVAVTGRAPSPANESVEPPAPVATTGEVAGPPIVVGVLAGVDRSNRMARRLGNGVLEGFEVDVARRLGFELGRRVRFVELEFHSEFSENALLTGPATDLDLLAEALDGDADLLIAAIAATPETTRRLRLSRPYLHFQRAIVVNPFDHPEIESLDDLPEGATVAVAPKSPALVWLESWLDRTDRIRDVRVVADEPSYVSLVYNGGATALLLDRPFAEYLVRNYARLTIAGVVPDRGSYGIAVDPSQPALAAEVDAALQEMIDGGAYQQIYDRWFDFPDGSVAP